MGRKNKQNPTLIGEYKPSSFAENLLKKQGWVEGNGLGKENQGINKSVGINIKNDTKGVGTSTSSVAPEVQWWDQLFNKTSAQLGEVKNEDNIKKYNDDSDSSDDSDDERMKKINETLNIKVESNKYLYGFVKSNSNDCNEEINVNDKKDIKKETKTSFDRIQDILNSKDSNSNLNNNNQWTTKMSDEELLKHCEFRTARKGARVEGNQLGKLNRYKNENEVSKINLSLINNKKRKLNDEDNVNEEIKKSKKDKKDKKSKKDKKDKKSKKDKKNKKSNKESEKKSKKESKKKSKKESKKKSKKESKKDKKDITINR